MGLLVWFDLFSKTGSPGKNTNADIGIFLGPGLRIPQKIAAGKRRETGDYTLFVLLILSYEVRKGDRSNVVLGQVVENI